METDGIYITNRCDACRRAITKLEVLASFQRGRTVCPCGSNRFKVSNFKLWEQLLLPRSWKLWWAIRKGRVAPSPTPVQGQHWQNVMVAHALTSDMEDDDCADFDMDSGFVGRGSQ